MRRTAATRIVSRVVLPSRVLAVGLGVGVGVLVVVICTNRSVQRLPPGSTPRQVHGGPRHGPPDSPSPQRSERPGGLRGPLRGASRLRRDAPSHPGGLRGPIEKRHGCAGTLRATPGVLGGPFEERRGCAGTLRATPGVLGGPFRGASRLRRDAPSHPGGLRGPVAAPENKGPATRRAAMTTAPGHTPRATGPST